MKAAFFHDHRLRRDGAGAYWGNGALPYPALARYLAHFDRVVVVAREGAASGAQRTLASGPGVEMACLRATSRVGLLLGRGGVRRHVREVMSGVDCAIVRLPSALGRIACEEAIRAGKPWLAEVVGCAFGALWHHGSLAGKLLAPAWYAVTRRDVGRAPFACYVSERFLQRRYPCRGASAGGCSNVAIEAPRREVLDARVARIEAGAAGRAPTLGLVGSLDVDYKGHATALRALALLRRTTLPGARLRLLGGGDPSRWRSRAAALGVGDAVELCGALPGGAPVLEWMDALDVLLVPSRTEGVPRALVEGMSRALPAVASRVGGVPELVDAEWTHAPGDARALAERVGRLAADRAAMEAQARRNWEAAGRFAREVLEERRSRLVAQFASAVARSRSPAPARAPARAEG
jgi:hypothetical protein